jgi:hypothetical protein
MSEPKQHHYIPETYLDNFCNEDDGLWIYDKWQRRSFTSRPGGVLKEHFYYAQPDYERKLWNHNIEKFFAEKIEDDWPSTVQLIQQGPNAIRELKHLYMFLYATRVRVPNCRKAVEYILQQQVRAVSDIVQKRFLDEDQKMISQINSALNSNFKSVEELYDAGVINITIDPHRSLLAMADLAKGFSLVASTIQLHFIKNCTDIDFNCSDNPIAYFPADQQPDRCDPYQFRINRPFEFIFPITKRLCLYHNSFHPIRTQQIVKTETRDLSFVKRINRFIGAFADRFVISSKEIDASELPTNNCPRPTAYKYPQEGGTFLYFQYEMGEPLQLPKWQTKFEKASAA